MKKEKKNVFKPISLGNDIFAESRYEIASRQMVEQLKGIYKVLNHKEFKDKEKEIYKALKEGILVRYVVDTFQSQTPAFQSISDENILQLFKLNLIELVELQKKFSKLNTTVKFVDNIPTPTFKVFENFTSTERQNEIVLHLNDMIKTYEKLQVLNPNLYSLGLCSALNQMLKLGSKSNIVINPDVINRMK